MSVGEKSYKLEVAVTDKLTTDKVLSAVPLGTEQATTLLMTAAAAADVTGTHKKRCGVVTRCQSKESESVWEQTEREAELALTSNDRLGTGCMGAETQTESTVLTTSSPGHTAKSNTARRSKLDGQTGTGSRVRVAVDLGGEKDSNCDYGVTVVNNNNTSSRGYGIDTNSGKTIDQGRRNHSGHSGYGRTNINSWDRLWSSKSVRTCSQEGVRFCKARG